jgi:hypothetical protein
MSSFHTTHNKLKRRTSMPSGGFEPETPVIEWPQIYAFDRTTNRIGRSITHWKGHSAERFYQLQTFFFVSRNQILYVFAPWGWLIPFRRFEVKHRVHLQGYWAVNLLITLRMEAVVFLETSEQINQNTTQKPRSPASSTVFGGTLNQCFLIVKSTLIYVYVNHFCVSLMHDWFLMQQWHDKSFHNICTSVSVNT